jgi:hypothetical protein
VNKLVHYGFREKKKMRSAVLRKACNRMPESPPMRCVDEVVTCLECLEHDWNGANGHLNTVSYLEAIGYEFVPAVETTS